MRPSLGALVITFNEEARLRACLRALDFCDERVVVDSFSTDRTLEIACEEAEHVYARAFRHHADQKNWGMQQLATDWLLIVDADEIVPLPLAREVVEKIGRADHDAWWIRRRNSFFGREIQHCGWNRDKVLRLLRRGSGHYPDAFVHEEIAMTSSGRIGVCEHRILHSSFDEWESSFARLLSYSSRGAYERRRRGRRAGVGDLAWRPAARFLRQFVVQRGFADGAHGVALCAWSAAGVFLREAKLLLGEPEFLLDGGNPSAPGRVRVLKGRDPVELSGDGAPSTAGNEESR